MPHGPGLWLELVTPQKRERIRRAAKLNPDLTHDLLAERFGVSTGVIHHALEGTGIRLEKDGFSTWLAKNPRRKHRRKCG